MISLAFALSIGLASGGIVKDSRQDLIQRSWYAWSVVAENPAMDSPDATYQPSPIDRIIWTFALADAVDQHGRTKRGRVIIPPELVAGIALRESRLNPSAILPGCPRRGKRPRYCNSDGYPDVGLIQLHLNPRWSEVTLEQALSPRENLAEGVKQLRQHYRAHAGGGCQRRAESGSWPWEWAAKTNHNWLQHHNMGSQFHGARVKRAWKRVKRRVRKRRAGYLALPIRP